MSLSQGRTAWRTVIGGLLLVLFVGIGWTFAQREQDFIPPETLIPSEAILYVQVDGGLKHAGAYRQTAAYKSLNESGLLDSLKKIATSAGEQREEVKDAMEALRHLQDHGLSLAIAVEPPNQGPPRAWGVIVVHQAAEGAEILSELVKRIPGYEGRLGQTRLRGRTIKTLDIPEAPVEVGWWGEKGHLLIAFGMNAIQSGLDLADGRRRDVTHNPLWEKYGQRNFEFAVTSASWFDFGALRKMFGEIPLPMPGGADDPLTVSQLLRTFGLDSLNELGSVSGYKGESCWTEVMVDADKERQGLLALMNQTPMNLKDLPPIPVGQKGIAVASIDWPRAFDVMLGVARNVIALAPPDERETLAGQLDDALAEFERELTISPGDLLAPLGHINCLYTDSNQGMFGLGSVGLVSLKDSNQAQENLGTLLARLEEVTQGAVRIREEKIGNRILTMVEMPKFPVVTPTIAVTKEWLIVGLVPQAVKAELLRFEGRLPSYDLEAAHAEAWKDMPEEFTSLTIVDPKDTYAILLGLAPTFVGLLELGMKENGDVPEDFEFPFNPADIPPAELVTTPLFANISMTTVGENGLHSYVRASLPGMPLLGGSDGGASVATTGVLVALLLPAVQQARAAARSAQSSNNLKMIGLALHNYHDTYNHFPAGTIENDDIEEVDERLSWLVTILPYLDEAALWTSINMKEAWNSELNEEALTTRLPVFLNPGATQTEYEGYPVSSYVGIAGIGDDAPELEVNHKRAGIFGYTRKTRIADIIDGTSNTMMVAEASDNGPWSAGGYSSIRAFTDVPYINGPDNIGNPATPNRSMVLMADGSVRALNPNIDPSVIEAMATIRGGENVKAGDF